MATEQPTGGEVDEAEARIILGVSPDASLEEARTAYRTLAKLLHPDRAGADAPAANVAMARINAAWEVMSTSAEVGAKKSRFKPTASASNESQRPPNQFECSLCGCRPADTVTYFGVNWTVLILFSLQRFKAVLCRSCGEATYASVQSRNWSLGWFGLGIFAMPIFGLLNVRMRAQIHRRPTPSQRDALVNTPLAQPLQKVLLPSRRRGVWLMASIGLVFVAALIGVSRPHGTSPAGVQPSPTSSPLIGSTTGAIGEGTFRATSLYAGWNLWEAGLNLSTLRSRTDAVQRALVRGNSATTVAALNTLITTRNSSFNPSPHQGTSEQGKYGPDYEADYFLASASRDALTAQACLTHHDTVLAACDVATDEVSALLDSVQATLGAAEHRVALVTGSLHAQTDTSSARIPAPPMSSPAYRAWTSWLGSIDLKGLSDGYAAAKQYLASGRIASYEDAIGTMGAILGLPDNTGTPAQPYAPDPNAAAWQSATMSQVEFILACRDNTGECDNSKTVSREDSLIQLGTDLRWLLARRAEVSRQLGLV